MGLFKMAQEVGGEGEKSSGSLCLTTRPAKFLHSRFKKLVNGRSHAKTQEAHRAEDFKRNRP